jgi:hypothetical protein
MRSAKKLSFCIIVVCLAVFAISGISIQQACADWLKMNPPPDVDKAEHQHGNQPTCWQACAANLLAGAGYGDGNNVQERADDIYNEMVIHFGTANRGWTDTAVNWWLQDANNTWKNTNPYTFVVIHGDPNCKTIRYPWHNTNLPEFVANELRECSMVQLSIRQPTADANIGTGGHAIATWGDGNDANELTSNPNKVKVSDSDYYDISTPVQTYNYDDYNNPNPGDCNEGVGWYINFSNKPHWYIDHVLTLSATDPNNPQPKTQTIVGSYKVQQNRNDVNARDFHTKVSAGGRILSYKVDIDWDANGGPTITEDPCKQSITVNWMVNDPCVPYLSWVTASAELVVPYDQNNTEIDMNNTYFTYPFSGQAKPDFKWRIINLQLGGGANTVQQDICGGYVLCNFSIYSDPGGSQKIAEFRSQHEYKYYETPEFHQWALEPITPGTYFVGNFKFGHSYALLSNNDLWAFNNWMSYDLTIRPFMPMGPYIINWAGRLPYPQGQNYTSPVPKQCGDPGTYYYGGDINRDCKVDWQDFALFAEGWLGCTDPEDPNCL